MSIYLTAQPDWVYVVRVAWSTLRPGDPALSRLEYAGPEANAPSLGAFELQEESGTHRNLRLVNLTPHSIVWHDGPYVITIPASWVCLRLDEVVEYSEHPLNAVVVRYEASVLEEIPPAVDGTFYIVSGLVLDFAGRKDFIAPFRMVRDAAGVITGCKGFRALGARPAGDTP